MKKRGQQFRRFLSILVILMLVWSSVPLTMPAYAATTEDGLEYKERSGGASGWKITGYTGNATELTIPDKIDGKRVTEIGRDAFANCTSLVTVVLPDTVKKIDYNAFEGCTNLKNVTLPDSIEMIEGGVFSHCTSLESIELPDGLWLIPNAMFYRCYALREVIMPSSLTSIHSYAFYECTSLTEFTIPASVTWILGGLFSGCTNLTDVRVESGNEAYCIVDGVLYDTAMTTLVYVPANRTGDFVVPETVTDIEGAAFDGCVGLTSITMPQGITEIGSYAFADCTGLECMTIPAGVTSISMHTFEGCTNLLQVDLPEGLTYIGESVFEDCASLQSITLPAGLTKLDYEAFRGCTSLQSIEIPLGITSIKSGTFAGCTGLQNITIPETVTSIGEEAFRDCGVQSITLHEGLTSIEPWTFADCTNLESITMPETLTSIGAYAFSGCNSMESFDIPDGVTNIDGYAFTGCSNLISIEFPEDVTITDGMSLSGCYSLTSIVIPDGVANLYEFSFRECTSLTSISIPDSVTMIGYGAFFDCIALEDVYYGGTEEQWNQIFIEEGNGWLETANIHFESYGNQHTHTWDEGTVTKAPTEESEGEKTFTCTVCGETRTEVLPKLDHVHKYEAAVTAPTCTDKGYTTYTCPCGDSYTADEVAALGHNFANGICSRCGEADPDYQEPEIPENPFSDVKETDYFLNPVLWAVEKGITSGTGNGQFSPNNTCTRGQVVTFLWRAMGQPEPEATGNPFSDVAETDYFYKPVLWAVQNGITSGTGGDKFSPNASCTRGQVVTFLWRAMGKPEPKTTENPFSDVKTADYFCEPVLWAVENQITSGTGGDQFSPNAFCTRGQVVTFLYRAFRNR